MLKRASAVLLLVVAMFATETAVASQNEETPNYGQTQDMHYAQAFAEVVVYLEDVIEYETVMAGIRDFDLFLQSLYTPPPRSYSSPRYVSNGGGHSDTWWRGVAQCEQGGQNDSYFGYFSFMDGSQGGRSWEDQVAAGNNLLSRVPERLSNGGAWADSCIDMGYAYSPGG